MFSHRLTAVPALLIAAGGLVVGLAIPAAGREAVRAINGSSIKPHSIAGNRLKNNTVTGAQVKESTLGTVPRATVATRVAALKWHPITAFTQGWRNVGAPYQVAAYAVDAQGLVHLRGALMTSSGPDVDGQPAFTLPATVVPRSTSVDVLATAGGGHNTIAVLQISKDVVTITSALVDTGTPAVAFTDLDGVTFSAG